MKLLLPWDKRRIHHFERLKTKRNDDGVNLIVKEQIRLLQVTNGARSILYMHDGNNGVVVTESAPEMGPARAPREARRLTMQQHLRSFQQGVTKVKAAEVPPEFYLSELKYCGLRPPIIFITFNRISLFIFAVPSIILHKECPLKWKAQIGKDYLLLRHLRDSGVGNSCNCRLFVCCMTCFNTSLRG